MIMRWENDNMRNLNTRYIGFLGVTPGTEKEPDYFKDKYNTD